MKIKRFSLTRFSFAVLAGIVLTGATKPAVPVAVFPGSHLAIPAPDATGARITYRPHILADGSQASPVFYRDGHGHNQQIATISRSIGVGWSPDGKRAFLQDNWGSNIADCYVLARRGKGVTGVSLYKLIQRSSGRPSGDEIPAKSHYYVHCDRWRSTRLIRGGVSGHTDSNPGHGFDHRFIYQADIHRLIWIR